MLFPFRQVIYIKFRLDLTAASQVHIVEPGWNPMLERQAIDRVYRPGQGRPVKTVRYIIDGNDSIEMVSRLEKN